MKYLILTWSLLFSQLAMSYPIGFKSIGGTTKYPAVVNVPSGHLSTISGGILLDSGDGNLLLDPNMEDTSTAAWTCTVGTCTKTTTAGEFSEGAQALKVALSAQAMNVTQSVSTGTGSITQYVVGVSYRVPSTMADFQICTLIAGSEKTCVPSANLILDDTYHTIEIPEVITPGSTVGIKFKTTTAYTANAFFDKAYIKQGIGTQNLKLDSGYSATITTTSGAVSNTNIANWISCTAVNPSVCTFASGIFTATPNCTLGVDAVGGSGATFTTAPSPTGFSVYTFTTTSGAALASTPVHVHCQKSGNDYLSSSSAVYSQASANYDWTAFTPTSPNSTFGTISATTCYHKRVGGDMFIKCAFASSAISNAEQRIALPNGLTTRNSTVNSITPSGYLSFNASKGSADINPCFQANVGYINFCWAASTTAYGISTTSGAWPASGTIYFETGAIPIEGWSNSSSIVGSFAGYNSTSGVANPKIFSANITTTSGAVANQYGSVISSCTAANPTVCTLTGLTVTPNCGIGNTTAAAQNTLITAKSSSSITISTASASQSFDLFCQGQ